MENREEFLEFMKVSECKSEGEAVLTKKMNINDGIKHQPWRPGRMKKGASIGEGPVDFRCKWKSFPW